MDTNELEDALIDYKETFGDTPTYIGLPDEMLAKAADVLEDAVDAGVPLTDEEFVRKLGGEPAPPDALT